MLLRFQSPQRDGRIAKKAGYGRYFTLDFDTSRSQPSGRVRAPLSSYGRMAPGLQTVYSVRRVDSGYASYGGYLQYDATFPQTYG